MWRGGASYFQLFELDAIRLNGSKTCSSYGNILLNHFDTYLLEPSSMFWNFQRIFFFCNSWGHAKTLRNQKVRTRENRGITVVPFVASRKRWLHSHRQWTVLLPYVRVWRDEYRHCSCRCWLPQLIQLANTFSCLFLLSADECQKMPWNMITVTWCVAAYAWWLDFSEKLAPTY